MNKAYALKSRHSASQGVTRYLMPGRRHQFTRSINWAKTFTSYSEACLLATVIGGMKVVEVEVVEVEVEEQVKYNNCNTQVDSHDLSNHFSATFVKIIFDSFKNNLDDLLATSEATCHCHSGTFNSETGHCDPPETCDACYAQSDVEALRTWSDDRIESWFEDVSPLSESPTIVCKTFDDFVASMKLTLLEYNALPIMVKHCLENQFINCVAEVETCLR